MYTDPQLHSLVRFMLGFEVLNGSHQRYRHATDLHSMQATFFAPLRDTAYNLQYAYTVMASFEIKEMTINYKPILVQKPTYHVTV